MGGENNGIDECFYFMQMATEKEISLTLSLSLNNISSFTE